MDGGGELILEGAEALQARAACPVAIVVPCYNEQRRLRPECFVRFAALHPEVRFVFVDDGSTDRTRELLAALATGDARRFELVVLPQNRGQGEAVRSGFAAALARGATYVGYWDADLATPLEEIPRFVAALDAEPSCALVLGSRRTLPGHDIARDPLRSLLGRLFANVATAVLRMRLYDTQCGAKLFRCTPELERLFAEPFISRWIFDVEILARLVRLRGDARAARAAVRELPLGAWRDVAGSKLEAMDFVRAPWELARIGYALYR